MVNLIKKVKGKYLCIKKCFKKTNEKDKFVDIEEQEFWDIYDMYKPYTMTSIERMYSLYQSVRYILDNNIKGSLVECGVWRGGSSMLIAKMLVNRGLERDLVLYDTFEGMSEPTENDVIFLVKMPNFFWKSTKMIRKTLYGVWPMKLMYSTI
jgi:hypothetical protein